MILRIVIILVIAFVAQWIGGRAVRRSVLAVTSRAPKVHAGQLRGAADDELASTLMEDRQGQRAPLGSLAKNALTITIWVIAVMLILSTLGVNIAPIIASGAVISAVLGFEPDLHRGLPQRHLNDFRGSDGNRRHRGSRGIVLGEVEETALYAYSRLYGWSGTYATTRSNRWRTVARVDLLVVEIPVPYDEDLAKCKGEMPWAKRWVRIRNTTEFYRDPLLLGHHRTHRHVRRMGRARSFRRQPVARRSRHHATHEGRT